MQLFEDTVENPEDALMQSRFKEQAKESKPYSMILVGWRHVEIILKRDEQLE